MKQAIFLISVASVGGAGAGDGVRDSGVTTHIPSGGDTQFDHLHTILHICLRRVVQNYTLFSYDLTILGIGNHTKNVHPDFFSDFFELIFLSANQ